MSTNYSVKLYPDPIETSAKSPVLGLCFSGGGSRAMTSALGQLSAFGTLANPADASGKLIGRVSFISSVSGGTWGSVPYVYLPETIDGQAVGDTDLLIAPQSPAVLYKGDASKADAANMAYMAPHCLGVAPGGFTFDNILKFLLQWIKDATEYDLPASWLWIDIVGKFILEPFGLSSVSYGPGELLPAKYFSLSLEHVTQNILPDNASLNADDFYLTRAGRPVLIANYNLLEDAANTPQVPVQATPVSTGLPGQSPDGSIVGGGACESFGFTSTLTGGTADAASVTMSRRYSLCDITGCSSAFFAQFIQSFLSPLLDSMAKDFEEIPEIDRLALKYALRKADVPKLKSKVASLRKTFQDNGYVAIVPQYNYWPLSAVGTTNANQIYGFGDGGAFDNTGLSGLLARTSGDIKAIAFVNCELALSFAANGTLVADDQLAFLFGYRGFSKSQGKYPSFGGMNPDTPMSYVQVFADDGKFADLLNELSAHACGGGTTLGADIAWARQTLTTVDNPVAGIAGGRTVEVLWVYNSPVARWQSQITDKIILEDLANGQAKSPSGDLARFPNYSTFLQFCLETYPVNMLAQLAAWTVGELQGEIADMLAG